jgi:hypothetical protein
MDSSTWVGSMKYFRIYRHHGGGLRGLRRVFDTFKEIDLFDIVHWGVNTRTIKTTGYKNLHYMY